MYLVSPNVPFWHILAPSVPFKISQVPNYVFHLYGSIGALKIAYSGFVKKPVINLQLYIFIIATNYSNILTFQVIRENLSVEVKKQHLPLHHHFEL